jgi:phosphate transport system substrate-binding protein
VVTNPENEFVSCLTVEELRRIWQPNSDVDNWNDIRPDFPDKEIALYGPGTASGTYDYFTEAVMGESGASRTDFTASEDDNVLVQGLLGDEGSLGFFGLAYYQNNSERLKLVGIDDGNPNNGEGCVAPTNDTVANGTYQPLSRPLLLYVRESSAADTTVSRFVNFYLDNVGDLARSVGYVELSTRAYDLAKQRFAERVTGTIFGGEGATVGVRVEDLLQDGPDASTASDADTSSAPADTSGLPADTSSAPADSMAAAR